MANQVIFLQSGYGLVVKESYSEIKAKFNDDHKYLELTSATRGHRLLIAKRFVAFTDEDKEQSKVATVKPTGLVDPAGKKLGSA